MKKGTVLLMIVLGSCQICFAQVSESNGQSAETLSRHFANLPDSVNVLDREPVKKGKITLFNGKEIQFSELTATKDSVSFLTRQKRMSTLPLSEIRGITKTKSHPGAGAAIGGVFGLAGGLLVGGIVNPRRDAGEWIEDQLDDEEESLDIRKEDLPYMAIGAAAGAAIGALVGLSVKKSTVLYFNKKPVDVFPVIGLAPGENPGVILTLKFTFE